MPGLKFLRRKIEHKFFSSRKGCILNSEGCINLVCIISMIWRIGNNRNRHILLKAAYGIQLCFIGNITNQNASRIVKDPG